MSLVPFKIKLIIVLNNFTTLIDVVKMYQILRVGVAMFSRILHDLIIFPWTMHTFDNAETNCSFRYDLGVLKLPSVCSGC